MEPAPPPKRQSRLDQASARLLSGVPSEPDDPFLLATRLSSSQQDDTDLEVAALEMLHAQQIQRHAAVVLRRRDGRVQLVDMARWQLSQRRSLLRTVMSQQESAADMLGRLRRRYDRAGVPMPAVTVRFRNLCVKGRVVAAAPAPPASGTSKVQTATQRMLCTLGRGRSTRELAILEGVSGMLRPGRFTVLLGPSAAGKSCLLRALAGRLRAQRGLQVSCDELTYNGHGLATFEAESTAAYISRLGLHFGELTCRETLDFAAYCCGTDTCMGVGQVGQLEARERQLGIHADHATAYFMTALQAASRHSLATDLMLRLLGLEACADTPVGNAMVRGISGGQKRRVTVGEMLVGPSNPLMADEISNGLDTATTLDILKALRELCHTMQSTVVAALLQPSPEALALADELLLLSSGRLVYQGPPELALPFFQAQGLCCPPGHAATNFLQTVTTAADQPRYWSGAPEAYSFLGAGQLEAAFWGTPQGAQRQQELGQALEGGLGSRLCLSLRRYGRSAAGIAGAVLSRGFRMQGRNPRYVVMRLLQSAIMGFCCGTLFLNQPKQTIQDGQMYMSIAYFSILCQQAGAFSAPTILINRLPAYFAQRDARFYPSWAIALAEMATQLPICFAEAWVWTLLVYFLVGYSVCPRLLMFWAIMLLSNLFTASLFMASSAACRTQTTAAAVQNFLNVVQLGSAGFLISGPAMPGPWVAAYWSNPLAYFIRALAINEMTSPDWNQDTAALVLHAKGYGTAYWWCWVAVAVGLGSYCLNVGALVAALSWLSMPSKPRMMGWRAYLERKLSCLGPEALSEQEARQWRRLQAGGKIAEVATPPAGASPPPDLEEGGGDGKCSSTSTPQGPAVVAAAKPPLAATPAVAVAAAAAGAQHTLKLTRSRTLSFQPVTMAFRNIEYSVDMPEHVRQSSVPAAKAGTGGNPASSGSDGNTSVSPHAGRLLLLRGVTGCFRPGVLTALMGASGAGKSCLVDVLTGRKTGGLTTGDIRINGQPLRPAQFAHLLGYVEQADVHLPQATVEEAVYFSARLRLPAGTLAEEARAAAAEVLDLVELSGMRQARVGLPGLWGLSQEQRRRLSIAVELAANPSLCFLDEPTSGLDSHAAALVMRSVRKMAGSGRTVVCTIHQPSQEIFEAFDELLLLRRSGQAIFFGPLGGPGAPALVSYLQALPGVPPITQGANPADWMMEVTSADAEAAAGTSFAEAYAASELRRSSEALVDQLSQPADAGGRSSAAAGEAASKQPGFWLQLGLLLLRNLRQYARLKQYQMTRLYITVLVGLLFGSLFWNKAALPGSTTTFSSIMFICGANYMGIIFFSRLNCLMVQEVIHVRRSVFYREHAAGMYGALPYALAEFLVELPFSLVNATLFSLLFWLMLGFQRGEGKFGWYLLFVFLSSLCYIYMGMLMVHAAPSLQLARTYAAFAMPLFNLFGGYLKPLPAIPAAWIWMFWATPFSYILYGLVVTQLGGVQDMFLEPGGGTTELQSVSAFIESFFGYRYSFRGYLVLFLLGFCLLFFAGCLYSLARIRWQKR